MPYLLRYFFKFLFEECKSKWGDQMSRTKYYSMISDFLIYKWILPACFIDLNSYGLPKNFILGKNCKENLIFLGKIFAKMMKLEDIPRNSDVNDKFSEFASKHM